MSEEIKDTTVGVSVDNAVSEKSMFEETVAWEDLTLARQDAVGAVLQNQQLITELTKLKSDAIEKDASAYELVNGLLNTYQEIAEDIRVISLEHSETTDKVKTPKGELEVPKTFKSGDITDNEDELAYIAIATNYISAIEKVGHITGTVYPGILLKLGMEKTDVEDAYTEGVKSAEGITNE